MTVREQLEQKYKQVDVPSMDASQQNTPNTTVRQQLEMKYKQPSTPEQTFTKNIQTQHPYANIKDIEPAYAKLKDTRNKYITLGTKLDIPQSKIERMFDSGRIDVLNNFINQYAGVKQAEIERAGRSGLTKYKDFVMDMYGGLKEVPGIKEASQAVGGVVGGVSGIVGGITGFLGQSAVEGFKNTRELLKGDFNFKDIKSSLKNIKRETMRVGEETARFGYETGKEAVPLAVLPSLGKIAEAGFLSSMGIQSAESLGEGIRERDISKITEGVTIAGMGLLGGRGLAKGGLRGEMLGSQALKRQITSDIDYIAGGKISRSQLNKATAIYRTILKPTKTEVSDIEIGKGKNINTYYEKMAQKQLEIKTGADGKLDTKQSINIISEQNNKLETLLQETLQSEPAKIINLNKIKNQVKHRINKLEIAQIEKNNRISDVDDILNAEIKVRGVKIDGASANVFKRGMWKFGYNVMRPTTHKTARLIGHYTREAIESAYKNPIITFLSKELGDNININQLLKNAHARPISSGKMGQSIAGLAGSVIGTTLKIPVLGPIVGKLGAEGVYKHMVSPERLSAKAIRLMREQQKMPTPILKSLENKKVGLSIEDVSRKSEKEVKPLVQKASKYKIMGVEFERIFSNKDIEVSRQVGTDKWRVVKLGYGELKSFSNPEEAIKFAKLTPQQRTELRLVNQSKAVKTIPTYKETGELTTKLLKKLEGRSTVSKQFISDLTNAPDLKQVEKDIIRTALNTEGDKINVAEFAKKVKMELLPLKVKDGSQKIVSGSGRTSQTRYENISLSDNLRGNVANYAEHIYESPIKTSAGDVHFSEQSSNYFGHTRIEDMANSSVNKTLKLGGKVSKEQMREGGGTTRRVIELQSDLYQKGKLEQELKNASAYDDLLKRGIVKKTLDQENRAQMSKLQQYNDPTAHFRMVREEVKQAAIDGKTKLQFPTGETAMKIEGLGDNSAWTNPKGERLLRDYPVKTGMEIVDASKNNWIITDVLGEGKFKAVSKNVSNAVKNVKIKEDILPNGKKVFLTNNGAGEIQKWNTMEEAKVAFDKLKDLTRWKEVFDISGKIDTSNPIYRFYEKDLGRYLKNNFDAKNIVDNKGVNWMEIDIKPEWKNMPVEAFGMFALPMSMLFGKKKEEIKEEISEKQPESRELRAEEIEYDVKTGKSYELVNGKKVEIDNSKAKKAILTVYNPLEEQTDKTPKEGGFLTILEFGDVAVGNRDEYKKAKKLFNQKKEDTFIKIPELENIKTPHGNGVFRVRDTFKREHDKKNKLDIFIPIKDIGGEIDKLVRQTPNASYYYPIPS